jgi:allantoin racemase
MTQAATRRLLLINPNTTQAMTDTMAAQIAGLLPPGMEVHAITAAFGHPVIATRVAYAVAAHAALDAYAGYEAPHDAVILGCFGDPGLEALREVAPVPVVALADASFGAVHALDQPFAVLTVGPAWKPMLEERLASHPAGGLCLGVHALDGTGLDFAGHPAHLIAALDREANRLTAAGAGTLILGGAVLAGLAPLLTAKAHIIDCIEAAARQAVALLAA